MTDSHERARLATLYHDVEQDIDCEADPGSCLAVIDDLLRLEERYGVTATYNVVGTLFESQPELVARIVEAGHEIAFHSYSHHPDCDPRRYAEEVAACRTVSDRPVGYRSPRSLWNESTLTAAWAQGFLWNAESDKAGEPYFIHEGLVRLPIAGDDWRVFTGDLTLAEWVESFASTLESRRYFGWGSHDCVFASSPTAYLNAYEQLINVAIEQDVRLVSFSQVADLYRRSALAAHYSAIANDWNRRTKALYRTRRFQEIVREEAERLEGPVVVDLGSGGGVLTRHLKDIASTIYCVDSAAGMLDEVPNDSVVRAVLGEVTDSTLPAGIADCVVCARVLEYVYDPALVADEIRRIGRTGAKVVATFPADRADSPHEVETVDDRIRRRFARDDVISWGSRLGPGEVLGVQYHEREPGNPAAEEEYRARERSQPPDQTPTNWVFVGRIENSAVVSGGYRLRPLPHGDLQFRFDAKRGGVTGQPV